MTLHVTERSWRAGSRPDDHIASDTRPIRLPRWRFAHLIGRHPLVRASDRVQALVLVLAVVMTLVAVPVAFAVGTAVYEARSRQYGEHARMSHVVTGTVTSYKVAYHESLGPTIAVLARWSAAGTEHSGPVPAPAGVKLGDTIDIWVKDDGTHAGPPPTTADEEAVAAGLAMWLGVAAAAAAAVAGTRAACDRARRARWQRDITGLVRAAGTSAL